MPCAATRVGQVHGRAGSDTGEDHLRGWRHVAQLRVSKVRVIARTPKEHLCPIRTWGTEIKKTLQEPTVQPSRPHPDTRQVRRSNNRSTDGEELSQSPRDSGGI